MIIECSFSSLELNKYWKDIFAKEIIYRELNYPVLCDKNKVFFLYIEYDTLLGFCAAKQKPNNVSFCNFYVYKDHRKKGVGTALFEYRLKKYKNKYIKATATKHSKNFYIRNNFKIIKTTKNYTFFERSKDEKEKEN